MVVGEEVGGIRGRPARHECAGAIGLQKTDRQGWVGTIKKRYGTRHYTAFEVLFSDGQSELFWDHQLEESQKPRSRAPWWRWLFR